MKSSLRVLMIEDSQADATLLIRELRRGGYQPIFHRVETREELRLAIDEKDWDVILSDYCLPRFSGTAALSLVQEEQLDIPFIIVSGAIGEETAVAAMKAGAHDYVMKNNLARLVPAVDRELREAETRRSRKRAEQALRQSEERFRAIFEGAKDCIFLKDKNLRYIDVNPAMENCWGLAASNIIGRKDEDLFPTEEWSYFSDVEKRVLNGATIEGEFSRKIQGLPVVYHEIRVPLRNSEGEIVSLCGILRDVTERKPKDYAYLKSPEPYPSEAMRSVLATVRIAAERPSTILLLGESGSGKDYLARYIHKHSRRAKGPFFSINCAAVAPELAESELFGHERGAFTGACGRKRGLLELAEGGTLLLNEIGELSLALQSKLLTFLDTRQYTRVGGEKNIQVDARLIAATNRDLEKEVETGRFRQDLFYRLNVVSIIMPPLRRRREDIPILVEEIMSKLRLDAQLTNSPELDQSAMNALMNYSWPGNVRELRNVLERALIVSSSKIISAPDLGLKHSVDEWSFNLSFPSDRSLNEVTRELKASLVNEALRRSGGCREDAARLLGISRHSLKHYMKSLGLNDDSDQILEHCGGHIDSPQRLRA
ncbi:MAG: sigma 54-interacting transcriptional regulator [Desulfomonile tiedjei]|uniref:Sigma 54-interacting transcriptional regulator n=1 Tax=Desulfomonile tiedjei TaxID=2358 RepID=A0A9D6Z2N2_9BACT|nr:sigma 54-interacting transcriptional regulator [Desulfomonile tiedjei]